MRYSVSISAAFKLIRHVRKTGSLKPAPIGTDKMNARILTLGSLVALISAATLMEQSAAEVARSPASFRTLPRP